MPFFGLGSDGLEYVLRGSETNDLGLPKESLRPLKQRVIHYALCNEQPSAEPPTFGCLMQSTGRVPGLDNCCRIRESSHQFIALREIGRENSFSGCELRD